MTICAVVKLRNALVAISDGRLSRDDDSVSFDTALKTSLFTPSYQFPLVRMGRFERFERYNGRRWGIAYSGTYSLATQIRDEAIRLSTSLYLNRSVDGNPELKENFERAEWYDDNYNFERDEHLPFGASDIFGAFEQACRSKGEEWIATRGFPDTEFLVFGLDQRNSEYAAKKICFDFDRYKYGNTLVVRSELVREMDVSAIGEANTVQTVVNDDRLRTAITESTPAEVDPAVLETMEPEERLGADLDLWEPSSTTEVSERLKQLVGSANHASIGGDVTVVTGRGGLDLRVESPA